MVGRLELAGTGHVQLGQPQSLLTAAPAPKARRYLPPIKPLLSLKYTLCSEDLKLLITLWVELDYLKAHKQFNKRERQTDR